MPQRAPSSACGKITAWLVRNHRMPPAETSYAIGNSIVCHRQKHCMPRAETLYAISENIVCQSRTAGSLDKKQWWRPQPPPLLHIFRPACHRRGRRSSYPSQRYFLHCFTDLDDIDTPGHAAYDSICAAPDTLSPGGIYLDHRSGCRAVAALDDYRAVNHLNYYF